MSCLVYYLWGISHSDEKLETRRVDRHLPTLSFLAFHSWGLITQQVRGQPFPSRWLQHRPIAREGETKGESSTRGIPQRSKSSSSTSSFLSTNVPVTWLNFLLTLTFSQICVSVEQVVGQRVCGGCNLHLTQDLHKSMRKRKTFVSIHFSLDLKFMSVLIDLLEATVSTRSEVALPRWWCLSNIYT